MGTHTHGSDGGRRSIWRSAARIGVAAAAIGAFLAPVALQVQPASAASAPTPPPADSCGYPTGDGPLATVFNESTIMRAVQVIGAGTGAKIAGWANDEKGLLLGISDATATATSFAPDPATGTQYYNHVPNALTTTVSLGDTTFLDLSNRPLYPTIFITNLTTDPLAGDGTGAGDWQHGGAPTTHIDDLFGSWTTAKFVGTTYTPTPPAHQNDWHIGTVSDTVHNGADIPSGGFLALGNEGYGAEVRWNANTLVDNHSLPLVPGNTYRFQVMTHDGDQNKGGDSGENCATLTIPALPAGIDIAKVADAHSVTAGSDIGFTITTTSTGAGTATGVLVTDTMPTDAGTSWSIDGGTGAGDCSIASGLLACHFGDMAPNASFTVHITSHTTAATVADSPVDNTAYVTTTNDGSDQASDSIVVHGAGIDIAKVADAHSVTAGSDIGFTITTTSTGAGTATGVLVTDTMPTDAGTSWSIDGGTGAGDCSIASGLLTCHFGDMAPGATFTVHISSPTTAATVADSPVDNTAYVTTTNDGSDHAHDAIVVTTPPCTENCLPLPSLAITKTADATPVTSGTGVGFTITVSNGGPGTATAVTVDDPLPWLTGITWTIQSQTGSGCHITGAVGSQSLSCTLGNMVSGASYSIHITSPTTAATHGSLPNTATASSTNGGSVHDLAVIVVNPPRCTSNCGGTPLVLQPSLAIVKTADAASVTAGDAVGFTITVSNGGPGVATAVTVNDPLPALTGVSWSIDSQTASACSTSGAVGSQVLSCTLGDMASGASYTVHVTSPTTTAGSLPNTAVASSSNGPNVEGTATIVVTPPAAPAVLDVSLPAPPPPAAPAPVIAPAALAFTGADVGVLMLLGPGLLLFGGLLAGAGRRRPLRRPTAGR